MSEESPRKIVLYVIVAFRMIFVYSACVNGKDANKQKPSLLFGSFAIFNLNIGEI